MNKFNKLEQDQLEVLKRFMQDNGVSKLDLVYELRVTYPTVCRIVKGDAVTEKTMRKLLLYMEKQDLLDRVAKQSSVRAGFTRNVWGDEE